MCGALEQRISSVVVHSGLLGSWASFQCTGPQQRLRQLPVESSCASPPPSLLSGAGSLLASAVPSSPVPCSFCPLSFVALIIPTVTEAWFVGSVTLAPGGPGSLCRPLSRLVPGADSCPRQMPLWQGPLWQRGGAAWLALLGWRPGSVVSLFPRHCVTSCSHCPSPAQDVFSGSIVAYQIRCPHQGAFFLLTLCLPVITPHLTPTFSQGPTGLSPALQAGCDLCCRNSVHFASPSGHVLLSSLPHGMCLSSPTVLLSSAAVFGSPSSYPAKCLCRTGFR